MTLLRNALPGSDRENVRQTQGLATHLNPLRQINNSLPLCNCSRPSRYLLVMSPEPKERLEKIDDGANLTLEEVEALKVGIAENDFDGWQTHSGQYVKVRFGAVYALYLGEDIGQGGVSFELEAVFRSKSQTMLA